MDCQLSTGVVYEKSGTFLNPLKALVYTLEPLHVIAIKAWAKIPPPPIGTSPFPLVCVHCVVIQWPLRQTLKIMEAKEAHFFQNRSPVGPKSLVHFQKH